VKNRRRRYIKKRARRRFSTGQPTLKRRRATAHCRQRQTARRRLRRPRAGSSGAPSAGRLLMQPSVRRARIGRIFDCIQQAAYCCQGNEVGLHDGPTRTNASWPDPRPENLTEEIVRTCCLPTAQRRPQREEHTMTVLRWGRGRGGGGLPFPRPIFRRRTSNFLTGTAPPMPGVCRHFVPPPGRIVWFDEVTRAYRTLNPAVWIYTCVRVYIYIYIHCCVGLLCGKITATSPCCRQEVMWVDANGNGGHLSRMERNRCVGKVAAGFVRAVYISSSVNLPAQSRWRYDHPLHCRLGLINQLCAWSAVKLWTKKLLQSCLLNQTCSSFVASCAGVN